VRRRLSARARIVGMTVGVVAVALAITVVSLRQVLLRDQARDVDQALEQEALELVEFVRADNQLDGETSPDFARRLLSTYLETNVTSRNESLVAVQNGIAFLQSAGAPTDIASLVEGFGDVVEPVFTDLRSEVGSVRMLVQPILDNDEQVGLLAISVFVDEGRGEVEQIVRDAAILAVAALLAATMLAWVVAGRVLRPITLLAATARDITEHDLTRRLPVQGADEIASLIASFNSMLDRLEGVIGTQRQFLDDASHELRTPITIMRGHLELADNDPCQLVESRDVVIAELDRMSRIVEDLLLLARAEQSDFLRRQPIDTDVFLASLVDRCQALNAHEWSFEEQAVGIIVADPDRLTQAMLNLAVNAARHTPPGGDIGIGGRFEDANFSMWVRDTGEGIDPDDHERIFQRFARATTTRSAGSAGLGLAIVQAIAEAHNGRVDVDSHLGAGATFTITIPVEPPRGSYVPQHPPADSSATRPEKVPPWHES
jgi:two-component system, OmpR family, sensor kinase